MASTEPLDSVDSPSEREPPPDFVERNLERLLAWTVGLGAAAGAVGYLAWLRPLRKHSHDDFADFLFAGILGGAAAAVLALLFWRAYQPGRVGWKPRLPTLAVIVAVPLVAAYWVSTIDSIEKRGEFEQSAMEIFYDYTHRFPHGMWNTHVANTTASFTGNSFALITVCGFARPDPEVVQQDDMFCAVIDFDTERPVIGSFHEDTETGGLDRCSGVARAECDLYEEDFGG